MTEVKFFSGSISPFNEGRCYIFMKSWKMRRNGCMESRDDLIHNLFFKTHSLIVSSKTILLIYKFPDIWSIVAWKRFYIGIHIKILPFVILLIFYMPHPVSWFISFLTPHIKIRLCALYFVRFHPHLRDIFFIASAHWTTFRLTQLIHDWQWTFWVQV